MQNRCNLELQHLCAELPCSQINPPDLTYPMWWVHLFLNLLFTIPDAVTPTCLCWLPVMYLTPGLGSTCSLALVAQLPPGMRRLNTAAQRCRVAWSPGSETCLARGSNVSSTIAVTLELKWKCSWCDNCSRNYKGQGQRYLFGMADISPYPKGSMLKTHRFSNYC